MIRFYRVLKRYANGYDALRSISLAIPRGAITFITGHSGAGKSTLLKLIARTEVRTRGQVLVDDQDIAQLHGDQIAHYRRTVGCVFQNHRLLHDRTVLDNVALPLIVAGQSARDCQRRARAALDRVGLLPHANKRPLMLSAGEQQRVGIARAVVARPKILLADEPTGNLDPQLADEIMQLLFLFAQLDVTVLIATHDHRHLQQPAAGLLVLHEGRVKQDSYT